jgi:hypothetical protein
MDFALFLQPTRSPSRLLSKLVAREGLSTLLVCLYPGERGYCVALGGSGASSKKGSTTATATAASAAAGTGSAVVSGTGGVVLPYEQDDLLRYIDREELPPGLGELLERSTSPLYYGGCVVAEVHDMRHCPAGHTRYVLLRPSNQVRESLFIFTKHFSSYITIIITKQTSSKILIKFLMWHC